MLRCARSSVAAGMLGAGDDVRIAVTVADVDGIAGIDRFTAASAYREARVDESSHLDAGRLVLLRSLLAILQPLAIARLHLWQPLMLVREGRSLGWQRVLSARLEAPPNQPAPPPGSLVGRDRTLRGAAQVVSDGRHVYPRAQRWVRARLRRGAPVTDEEMARHMAELRGLSARVCSPGIRPARAASGARSAR
jgi:hypothetical protein